MPRRQGLRQIAPWVKIVQKDIVPALTATVAEEYATKTWGTNAKEGLRTPPVFFPDTNFSAVKRVNNSAYHSGIMAIFQTTGAYVK